VASLRERLPADLRAAPGPEFAALPFRSLYLTDMAQIQRQWQGTARRVAR
jgi:hypothetical protein